MSIAIKVENLGKEFVIGGALRNDNFREYLSGLLMAPFRRFQELSGNVEEAQRFKALSNVSFEITKGEIVGLIGANGAGKSTLLKILSRITPPTTGRVEIEGKIGSLLEVGTGFNHELTGRENIYLNGAILGMQRSEITAQLEAIVAFSGVSQFLDTPVKRYSSGMFVRLAFAVAAHLRVDTLLVDEVLSVGDQEFQKKCLGKMSEVAQDGRTVVLVSHNMAAIQNLCKRTILLRDGTLQLDGKPDEIIATYLRGARDALADVELAKQPRSQNHKPLMKNLVLRNNAGESCNSILAGQGLELHLAYEHDLDLTAPYFGFTFMNHLGVRLFTVQTEQNYGGIEKLPRQGKVVCKIPSLPLAPGHYTISLGCGAQRQTLDVLEQAVSFEVHHTDVFGTGFLLPAQHSMFLVDSEWNFSGETS